MPLPPNLIHNVITYGIIGFGVLGSFGAIKTYTDSRKFPDETPLNLTEDEQFPNIKYDPNAQQSIKELKQYQHDKLIGLQILINNKDFKAEYPYKASRYASNVKLALSDMEKKLRNVSVPYFPSERDAVIEIAENYAHNINADCTYGLMDSIAGAGDV